MELSLKDIEPFNIPPVDNHDAAAFIKHLTGQETLTFSGEIPPRSFLLYDLKYSYPARCYAHGWLLSIDISSFLDMCNLGAQGHLETILMRIVVGSIFIEFGGDITGCRIFTENLEVSKN